MRRSVHSAPAGIGALGRLESPFVEDCIARVRALYAVYFEKKKPLTLQAALWDAVCNPGDRRFLCAMAKLPRELAECPAAALKPGELQKAFVAFANVRRWAATRDMALDRIGAELR